MICTATSKTCFGRHAPAFERVYKRIDDPWYPAPSYVACTVSRACDTRRSRRCRAD